MKRYATVALFLACGLVIGAAATYFAVRPTSPWGTGAPARPEPVAVAQVDVLDQERWRKAGFVEMVPPVRLPTSGSERDHIAVWLSIPDGANIDVRTVDGRPTLRFPPGTVADRIESFADTISDVRGTVITRDDGQLFHVYVPRGPEQGGPLVGWEWPRGDDAQQRAATALLTRHLAGARFVFDAGAAPSPEERARIVDDYARSNQCARCHTPNRAMDVDRAHGIHRATDDDGFYVPLSVLADSMPLETHRPRDMNVDDPFLALACPSGRRPELTEHDDGGRAWICADGGSPVGTLDVKAALAKKDARAIALCASRAYLAAHMDADGKRAFAAALAACAIRP